MNRDFLVPEQDGGESIAGESAISADLWIRREDVGDISAAIRTLAVPLENARTGSTKMIPMAREERHHLVVPRHMPGMLERLTSTPLVFGSDAGESGLFEDTITLRENQLLPWQALSENPNGILNLACGFGKTVLALKRIAARGEPGVVIVNNAGLLSQWISAAEQHLGLCRADIGVVRGPKEQWDRPLVLAMVLSLANRADTLPLDIRRRFGTAVYDETHHLAAESFLRTANLFFGDRLGLTATAEREDGLEGVYYAHLGGIFHTNLQGDIPADVYFRRIRTDLGRSPDIYDAAGELSMGKLHIALSELPSRNRLILRMVEESLRAGRRIIALSHAAAHPHALLEMFKAQPYSAKYTAGAINGDTRGDERMRILGESDVTFATLGVSREGLDESRLDTVFFLTPFKAWGWFQQGKGRAERRRPGKKQPVAVVLEDVGVPMAGALCASLRKKARQNGVHVKTITG